jgi:hypothetical protein
MFLPANSSDLFVLKLVGSIVVILIYTGFLWKYAVLRFEGRST